MPKKIILPKDKVTGHAIGQFVIESLKSLYSQDSRFATICLDDFVMRFCSKERMDRVLDTGTDREESSTAHSSSQERALSKYGLTPKEIIYTYPLSDSINLSEDKILGIYELSKLERLDFEGGTNAMYKERKPHTFLDALVAVFCYE